MGSAEGAPQALKRVFIATALTACLKACPDTNQERERAMTLNQF